MPVLMAIALLSVLLVGVAGSKSLSRRARTHVVIGLCAAVFTLLCLRFGFGWLSVAGGVLVALASRALPVVIRLLLGRRLADGQFDNHRRSYDAPGDRGRGRGPAEASRSERMSRAEALRVLDLSDGASDQEILDAYRRVMKSAHPDHGGSTYLAAKINEARDVLLPG